MNKPEFEKGTIAIRLRFRMGSQKQSQVFFPQPTLVEALANAKKEMYSKLADGFKCSLSEAKRVSV